MKIEVENEKIDISSIPIFAGRGGIWQILGGVWQTLIRLGASTVLARLLSPEDFGIVALSFMVYGLFSSLTILSSTTGILAKASVGQEDLNTAFWLGAIIHTLIFICINLSAPVVARVFSEEKLLNVLPILSILFLTNGIGLLPMTLLTKRLLFKKIVCVNGIAVVFETGLSIILVQFFELGYLALVYSMVICNAGVQFTYVLMGNWRPKFSVSKSSFFNLIRYGMSGFGVNWCIYIRQNIDYFVIGKYLGSHLLGLYSFAYKLPDLILKRLAMPVGGIVLPAMSHLSGNNELIIKAFTKASQYLAIMIFPILSGLGFLAEPIVFLLWGDQWGDCITPIRILCGAAAISCLGIFIGSIFMCKDKPGLVVKIEIFNMCYTIAFVVPLTIYYGLIGAASGMLLSKTSFFLSAFIAFRLTWTFPVKYIVTVFRVAINAIFCGFSAFISYRLFAAYNFPLFPNTMVSILIGAAIYFGAFRFFLSDLWAESLNLMQNVILGNRAEFWLET